MAKGKKEKKAKKAKSQAFRKTLHFAFRNETKGAVRYDEVDDDGTVIDNDSNGKVVGSLYIRKSALNDEAPAALKMILIDAQLDDEETDPDEDEEE